LFGILSVERNLTNMNSKFLIIVILILVLVNLFTLASFRKYRVNNFIRMNSLEQEMEKIVSLESNLFASAKNNNNYLRKVLVKDSLGNIFPLNKIFQNGKSRILICRFSEMDCESCINYSIKTLLDCSNMAEKNNILFLGTYRNNKIFNRHKPLYGIDTLNTLNTTKIDLPIEDLGYPYYMVLDSALQVLNVYIPNKGTPAIDRKYINLIYGRYFGAMK